MDVMSDMDRIVPARPPPSQRSRQTRSWIPFLGDVLHTVAGTATSAEVNKALKAVDEMRKLQAGELQQWSKAEGDIASLSHVVHDGLDALRTLVNEQRQSNVRRYYQLSGTVEDIFSMSSLIPVVMTRIIEFNRVLVHASDLRNALIDVLHGHLNTFLIPSDRILAAMRLIALELTRIHPSLRLATQTVGDAYQLSDFVLSRIGRNIFITIKFPVTPVEQPLTLYDVVYYPVLLPDDSNHVTLLNSDVQALALSQVADYYMEFRTQPIIHNRLLHLPTAGETLRNSEAPTCIYALFRNSLAHIRTLCSFLLLPHSLEPSVLRLDASNVLFTNVSNITRSCTDSTYDAQLSSCRQCIYHLPCACSFNTPIAYVPPALHECRSYTDNRTTQPVTHVTNLAVLSNFFSEKDLGQLASDTILTHPVQAIIPNFTLLGHNYSNTLAAIDKTEFKLEKAANISKSRAVAFRSMAEYRSHKHFTDAAMTDDDDDVFFAIPSYVRSPLAIVSVILSVIALALTILVGVKLKMLSLLLLNARTATAFPSHLDFFKTTTAAPVSPFLSTALTFSPDFDLVFLTQAVVTGIIIVILACLCYVYLWPKYWEYKRSALPRCKIYLQLKMSSAHLYIPFMTLESHISCYVFSAPDPLKSIKVEGTLFPYLVIDWPSLSIAHILLNETVTWPQRIKLTYSKASTLRTALPCRLTRRVLCFTPTV